MLAAGGRPVIPDIPGLDEDVIGRGVGAHLGHDHADRPSCRERLVVVGGGYIAAEFAHVFASFGTRVTQLVRGSRLLRHHDADIATTFTDYTQQPLRPAAGHRRLRHQAGAPPAATG